MAAEPALWTKPKDLACAAHDEALDHSPSGLGPSRWRGGDSPKF
jgi:hypothetical protein